MRAAASPSRASDLFIYLLIYFFLAPNQIVPLKQAYLRSSSVRGKIDKNDIPNVKNNGRQLALAARDYQSVL